MLVTVTYQMFDLLKQMPKRIACGKCGCEYVYVIRRSAFTMGATRSGFITPSMIGLGDPEQDLKDAAYRRVHKELIDGAEPAQCPDCGWYEPAAIREIRRRHLRWMLYGGMAACALLFPFGLLLLFYNDPFPEHAVHRRVALSLVIAAGSTALAMFAGRHMRISRLDPNSGYPDHRPPVWAGAPEVMRKGEYESLLTWSKPEWTLSRSGKQRGGYSLVDFVTMLRAGKVSLDDLIWKEGRAEWTLLRDVPGLGEAAASSRGRGDHSST